MTALVSIRLSDTLLQKMRAKAHVLKLSQSDYIREAIKHMNNDLEKQEIEHRLKQASLRVRKQSMKINAEFSEIDYDPEA